MAVVGSPHAESFSTGIAGDTFARVASFVSGATSVWNPGFTDLGGGFYRYAYTPTIAGAHEWVGNGSMSGAIVINFDVVTAAQADPAAALSAAVITTISPVDAVTGDVAIVRGDDYRAADARALGWATTSSATWPDLTGATIAFTARHAILADTQTFAAAGAVVVATGATKQVRVEIVGATTAGKLPGGYLYDVQATLAGGGVVTLATGVLTLAADRTT